MISVVMIACVNKDARSQGKSRVEQIDALPFRTLTVSEELKNELFNIGDRVWREYITRDTANDIKMVSSFYQDARFDSQLTSKNIDLLREQSYEIWRKKGVKWTALTYKSFLVNYSTNINSRLFVIEIEHKDLTGTYYIFAPLDGVYDKGTISCTYRDRN